MFSVRAAVPRRDAMMYDQLSVTVTGDADCLDARRRPGSAMP